MKKKNLYPSLLILLVAIATTYSCGDKKTSTDNSNTQTQSDISKEDSAKIAAYDFFFGKSKLVDSDLASPVEDAFVVECLRSFDFEFRDNPKMNIKNIKKAYTSYASFEGDSLAEWVNDMHKNTNTTDFRIYLGVYSKKAGDIIYGDESISRAKRDSVKAKRGRLTIIISPYYNNDPAEYDKGIWIGTPAKSFNLGSIHPQ